MNQVQKSKTTMVFPPIAWYGKHFGEEPPLVGNETQGAGTIFFSGCNLHCVFCQNYQISQENLSKKQNKSLTKIMLELQDQEAVNIDLVTPTMWWRHIKAAVLEAKSKGLKIPIVWNSNAYEPVKILQEMEGIVDIYLPDFKYGIDETGERYSGVRNYVETAKKAIQEMIEQTGKGLEIKNDIAKKGIIIRHLVLPGNIENSLKVLDEISEIDQNIHVSLMSQFNPVYKTKNYSDINRKLNREEWEKVCNYMEERGLDKGWMQDLESAEIFSPDFRRNNPF
jgi:putative pyruvate formate lyase activating enzyme